VAAPNRPSLFLCIVLLASLRAGFVNQNAKQCAGEHVALLDVLAHGRGFLLVVVAGEGLKFRVGDIFGVVAGVDQSMDLARGKGDRVGFFTHKSAIFSTSQFRAQT